MNSPTYGIGMFSPCSKKLLHKKKIPTKIQSITNIEIVSTASTSGLILPNIETVSIPRSHTQPTDLPIILGSSSASRTQVLVEYGWQFTTMSPDIDEKAIRSEDPMTLPLLIAQAKATALVNRLIITDETTEQILITSDQIVLYKGM